MQQNTQPFEVSPPRLTWNPKMNLWKSFCIWHCYLIMSNLVFRGVFHLNYTGCFGALSSWSHGNLRGPPPGLLTTSLRALLGGSSHDGRFSDFPIHGDWFLGSLPSMASKIDFKIPNHWNVSPSWDGTPSGGGELPLDSHDDLRCWLPTWRLCQSVNLSPQDSMEGLVFRIPYHGKYIKKSRNTW